MSMSSHLRDSLLGWAAVMTSNSCLLANSFIAKHQPVTPGEILSSRLVTNKIGLFSTHRAMFKLGGKNLFVLCLLVKNLSAVYSADRCDF